MPVEGFLKVINGLPDAVLLVSREGVILGANRRLVRLGVAIDGLKGRSLAEIAVEPHDAIAAYLGRCARTAEPVPGILTLRNPGGQTIACRSDGSLLVPASPGAPAVIMLRLVSRDESVSQFLMLNRKIDELGREILKRQHVEDELRDQKEWLAVTLASIGDAVIATDIEGRVIFMNPVAVALTGWGEDEATGRPLDAIFQIVNEETREPVENPVTKCLRQGVVVGLANHTVLISRDGAEISIDDTAAPIRKPGGQVKGVVLIFHDVGERRLLERQLQDRARLLLENDRRKDEFLAMLAHELRNPLASISNALQLLGRLETEDDLVWAKEVVDRQVKHLARLIDDLLDVSRISRGKISLRQEPLSLSPIIAGAIEAVRPLLEERKHELSVSLVEGGLRLNADPLRMEQVLINLLTNAAKYTEAGGRIALTARHEGAEVVIKVRDTGMGMTPELLPRVFDLFAQGDRTIARSEGGLGIGLTLVQKLVEMHGGTVSAASDGPGKGSEFTVRLPALDDLPPRRPDTDHPTSRGPGHRTVRVLVVDDNVDNARGLSRLLKLLGHDVQVVYDGQAAIEAAHKHRPEIILLDIGLPVMDGYEVVAKLRNDEACKHALIIAVSGYGQPDDLRRSRDAGFDHHLVKPLDFDALTALIS